MLDTRLELNGILTRRCDSDGKEARFHRIHIEPEIPQTICNMLSVLKCKALQAVRMCAHNNVRARFNILAGLLPLSGFQHSGILRAPMHIGRHKIAVLPRFCDCLQEKIGFVGAQHSRLCCPRLLRENEFFRTGGCDKGKLYAVYNKILGAHCLLQVSPCADIGNPFLFQRRQRVLECVRSVVEYMVIGKACKVRSHLSQKRGACGVCPERV